VQTVVLCTVNNAEFQRIIANILQNQQCVQSRETFNHSVRFPTMEMCSSAMSFASGKST
jgi:hypothetical protein